MQGVAITVPTYYSYDGNLSYTDGVSWITSVASSPNITFVYSISYGSYDVDELLSALDSFNTEAIKLGVMGVTIMTSVGDDGIAGKLIHKIYSKNLSLLLIKLSFLR